MINGVTKFKNLYIGTVPYEKYVSYGYIIPITVSNGSESKTTNVYINEPLRKVGDVVDYLDLKNSKVIKYIGEKILEGNENGLIILLPT